MADRTVNGLRAAIKALKETVAPAVDAANPLASEQLRMVCGYLALVCEQLPHRHGRLVFELRVAIDLAVQLAPDAARCEAPCAAALAAALERAHGPAADALATEADIEGVTRVLNAAISALVRSATVADDETRQRIERTVAAHAKPWLTVQRAWFRPLGFDGDAALPALGAALGAPVDQR